MSTPRSSLPFVALAIVACGARTELADGEGSGGAHPSTTSATSTVNASSTGASSASSSSAGPLAQCACPDAPGYAHCPAGLDCCACNDDGLGWTVDRCEDPATFNCSCGDPLSCP